MKLTNMTITDFAELLASDAPAPGGGSVSALVGSLGIALTKMVAALTIGRESFSENEETMQKIHSDAGSLSEQFMKLTDLDTDAYNNVTSAFKLPKETQDEKTQRSKAIQKALEGATDVPFQMMATAQEALELTHLALDKANPNAASDLGVAALALGTAVRGAWLNVKINIGSLKDRELAGRYEAKGQEILDKVMPLADEVYMEIVKSL